MRMIILCLHNRRDIDHHIFIQIYFLCKGNIIQTEYMILVNL